jgi:cytochrome c biogenesis protein ResB
MIIYQQGLDNQVLVQDAEWPQGLSHTLNEQGRTEYYVRDGQKNFVKLSDDPRIKKLPFDVRLSEFVTEYYSPANLFIHFKEGGHIKISAEPGAEFILPDDASKLTVVEIFENCKIRTEDGRVEAFEDSGPGSNPAVRVRITYTDGSEVDRYVFERFPGHGHPEDKFELSYQRTVSDWISRLQVLRNNRVVKEKSIEVNKPLHFGGYNFYQHSYDPDNNQFTVLLVTSDTGLILVFAGYLLLIVGVFSHFWLRPVIKAGKRHSKAAAQKGDSDGN